MNENQNKKISMFTQTSQKTKKYRHDYSMSMDLRDELLANVFLKFARETSHLYYEELRKGLKEFADEHDLPDEKAETVMNIVFWLRVLYELKTDPYNNIVQDFIKNNENYFKKWPILKSWIQEWYNVTPNFYYISQRFGGNGNVAVDIKSETTLDIFYPFPNFSQPKQGALVAGILLPFCDSLYFPITEFYEFDQSTLQEVVPHIRHYFRELSHEPDQFETFLRMFSSLLKVEQITYNHLQK
ncbi:hypothetical protein [Alkalibacillus silvisoli]|uniref:Uncharacterized protein n=1 Tax=Alkalibacillus silvisoli TaxID=392823 RepID=A0ABN0ZV52_9BACI